MDCERKKSLEISSNITIAEECDHDFSVSIIWTRGWEISCLLKKNLGSHQHQTPKGKETDAWCLCQDRLVGIIKQPKKKKYSDVLSGKGLYCDCGSPSLFFPERWRIHMRVDLTATIFRITGSRAILCHKKRNSLSFSLLNFWTSSFEMHAFLEFAVYTSGKGFQFDLSSSLSVAR